MTFCMPGMLDPMWSLVNTDCVQIPPQQCRGTERRDRVSPQDSTPRPPGLHARPLDRGYRVGRGWDRVTVGLQRCPNPSRVLPGHHGMKWSVLCVAAICAPDLTDALRRHSLGSTQVIMPLPSLRNRGEFDI
jgi:hypothetical protein